VLQRLYRAVAPFASSSQTISPAAFAQARAIRVLLPGMTMLTALVGCHPMLPPLPPADTSEYQLGPGDRIRIITFGGEELTGEFRVNDSGDIAVPLVGTVQAAGLTSKQLEQRLEQSLTQSHLFKNPSVSVEIVAYRPIFVLGEVSKPGQYPYQPGMTVLTAVAIAGGFTYRAIEDSFSVVRTVGGKAVEGQGLRQTFVQPGDVITVYERHF
jgi:polysaccharide export outer membrane protein